MGAFRVHSYHTRMIYFILLSSILFNHTVISVTTPINQGQFASFPTVDGQQSTTTPISSGSSGFGFPQAQSQSSPLDDSVQSGDSGSGGEMMPSTEQQQGSQFSNQQQQQNQFGFSGSGSGSGGQQQNQLGLSSGGSGQQQQQQSLNSNGGFVAANTNQLNGLPFQKVNNNNNNNNLNNNNLNSNNPFLNGARTKQDCYFLVCMMALAVVAVNFMY